jgi:hypothetical protein
MGKKVKKEPPKKPISIVNEEIAKNYKGKNNRTLNTSSPITPGVADTPAQRALRMGDLTYRTDYKKTVPPSGRPAGEKVAVAKYRAKQELLKTGKAAKKGGKK